MYDDTLLGTNREGFAVCESGLYWRNDWTSNSKRTYLSWDEFANRSIKLKDMEIKLGRGDTIGIAGAGEKKIMKEILNFFRVICAIAPSAINAKIVKGNPQQQKCWLGMKRKVHIVLLMMTNTVAVGELDSRRCKPEGKSFLCQRRRGLGTAH